MKFDDLLTEHLGELGRFQKIYVFSSFFFVLGIFCPLVELVFQGVVPPYVWVLKYSVLRLNSSSRVLFLLMCESSNLLSSRWTHLPWCCSSLCVSPQICPLGELILQGVVPPFAWVLKSSALWWNLSSRVLFLPTCEYSNLLSPGGTNLPGCCSICMSTSNLLPSGGTCLLECCSHVWVLKSSVSWWN